MRLNKVQAGGVRVYGDLKFRGKCPTEGVEQATFFNTLRLSYPDTWGLLALHPRNEAQLRGGQFAAIQRQRAEGMAAGAADIIIPGAPAFVCELKRQDHTKSAWQDGQEDYLIAAVQAGTFACVALGWEAAWEAFTHYLSSPLSQP